METPETEEPKEPKEPKTTFLAELKRRKVFRVAGTYAVVSWLVIQVASATFSNFGIPQWAFRFVVLMLLLGFPIALILAWAFDLTPDGVRVTRSADAKDSKKKEPGLERKRNWLALGMAAGLPTLIFGTLALIFYFGRSDPEPENVSPQATDTARPYVIGTIAILPFTVIAEDSSIKVMADALQEEMLTAMSSMGPLNVVSRTSTLRFADPDTAIPEIGKTLGADFVVEGSIQAVGDSYRVTLQLIQAINDNHIWAESFNRATQPDQDRLVAYKELAFDLAIEVYQALEQAMPPKGGSLRLREGRLNDLSARLETEYTGLWTAADINDWQARHESVTGIITEIIQLDPDNKAAYDKLAGITYARQTVELESIFNPDWRNEFYLTLKRAYAVNPDGFDVNKHLGIYYFNYENRPGMAIPYSRRAVELEEELRGSVDIYTYWILLESLLATGQNAAALAIVEDSMAKGIVNFSGNAWFWTETYFYNYRYEDAIKFLDEQIAFAESPSVLSESGFSSSAIDYKIIKNWIKASWTGDRADLEELQKAVADSPPYYDSIQAMAAYFLGEYDKALEMFSSIQVQSSPFSGSGMDLAEGRAWVYLKSGNLPLAQSYFKGYLGDLSTSPRGEWMQEFSPALYSAQQAYGNAFIGNREETLEWVRKAKQQANPMRNLTEYFKVLGQLAVAYSLIGEVDSACELLDQALSSPSWLRVGFLLLNPQFEDLHDDPRFQAVIRKHADQLKDPAIIDEVLPVLP